LIFRTNSWYGRRTRLLLEGASCSDGIGSGPPAYIRVSHLSPDVLCNIKPQTTLEKAGHSLVITYLRHFNGFTAREVSSNTYKVYCGVYTLYTTVLYTANYEHHDSIKHQLSEQAKLKYVI